MKCHSHAEAMGIKTRADAWKWIAHKASGRSPGPQWQYADLVDNIGGTLARIFRRIGLRRFSLYVHPQMAREFTAPCNIVRLRRMEFNHRELVPRRNRQRNESPTLWICWSVLARNIGRIRRRWLRVHTSTLPETIAPDSMSDGTVPQAPSDDETIPAEQQDSLFRSPPFDSVGLSLNRSASMAVMRPCLTYTHTQALWCCLG